MADGKMKSKTMRIDLIPDIPNVSQGRQRIRVVKNGGASKSEKYGSGGTRHKTDEIDMYHELLHAIYDAAVITDINGVILEVNERAIEFLQWDADELKGASIVDIISGAGGI